MSHFTDLRTLYNTQPGFSSTSEIAQWRNPCSSCGSKTMLAVAICSPPEHVPGQTIDNIFGLLSPESAWLLCPACDMGAFGVGSPEGLIVSYPEVRPFGFPENLNDEVRGTWNEALSSYAASAYTASALMCRKIIFHMAVETGLSEKNARGWAPSFEQCVDHLVLEGHITNRQKDKWVDSIRVWGNTATHELDPVTKEVAHSALQFTLQLLQMIYEFPRAAPSLDTR